MFRALLTQCLCAPCFVCVLRALLTVSPCLVDNLSVFVCSVLGGQSLRVCVLRALLTQSLHVYVLRALLTQSLRVYVLRAWFTVSPCLCAPCLVDSLSVFVRSVLGGQRVLVLSNLLSSFPLFPSPVLFLCCLFLSVVCWCICSLLSFFSLNGFLSVCPSF